MGEVIVIASGKGGTGKTTCAAAISSFLATDGHSTLCIDCDIGLRNLDLALGLTDISAASFYDVIAGRYTLDDAVTCHPKIDKLSFLSAPATVPADTISRDDMAKFFDEIRDKFDYCIIDAPAGIGSGFKLACSCADRGIIVTTGDAASLRDGQRTVAEMDKLNVKDIRLIINRLSPKKMRRLKATLDDAIDAVGARLIGLVSEDDSIQLAANLETPLYLFGARHAWDQFLNIARRIAGERTPLKIK